MSPDQEKAGAKSPGYAFNLTLAAVAGEVGCLTLVIVLVALLGGLWIDNYFGSKPIITIILMFASIPVTLVTMIWVVRTATSHLKTGSQQKSLKPEESEDRGETS